MTEQNKPGQMGEQKPFYMTVLVKYDSEDDAPRVGANESVLGGSLVGVSFSDMFAEMEALQSPPVQERDGLTREEVVGIVMESHKKVRPPFLREYRESDQLRDEILSRIKSRLPTTPKEEVGE